MMSFLSSYQSDYCGCVNDVRTLNSFLCPQEASLERIDSRFCKNNLSVVVKQMFLFVPLNFVWFSCFGQFSTFLHFLHLKNVLTLFTIPLTVLICLNIFISTFHVAFAEVCFPLFRSLFFCWFWKCCTEVVFWRKLHKQSRSLTKVARSSPLKWWICLHKYQYNMYLLTFSPWAFFYLCYK